MGKSGSCFVGGPKAVVGELKRPLLPRQQRKCPFAGKSALAENGLRFIEESRSHIQLASAVANRTNRRSHSSFAGCKKLRSKSGRAGSTLYPSNDREKFHVVRMPPFRGGTRKGAKLPPALAARRFAEKRRRDAHFANG